jgi:hypothetical protein
MKILLSLVALLCLSSLALALPDQSPDVMGIYFDTDYLSAEISAPINTPFIAYAVLSNPTQAAISGFEFGYNHWVRPEHEASVFMLATYFPEGVVIINPPFDPMEGSYSISLPTPIPASETVVLLSWQYMLVAPNVVMHFFLTEADSPTLPGGLPVYWGPDGARQAGHAGTCFGTGARTNEYCPLPTEPHSWGTLKGLYR